jgi:hypothetical protein
MDDFTEAMEAFDEPEEPEEADVAELEDAAEPPVETLPAWEEGPLMPIFPANAPSAGIASIEPTPEASPSCAGPASPAKAVCSPRGEGERGSGTDGATDAFDMVAQ